MNRRSIGLIFFLAVLLLAVGVIVGRGNSAAAPPAVSETRPALSVSVVRPQSSDLPLNLSANGSIAAWQEAVIGAEVGGLRLAAINAQVGDSVKKGQVLAIFDDEKVVADVTQSRAALAEAEANLAEAKLNAERVDQVTDSGALSALQAGQYRTAAKTAEARMRSAKAQLDQQLLRLRHVKVLASDDGVISSRTATLGAVAAEGQELFRLIRQNRLEWRAELTGVELMRVKPGVAATVEVPGAAKVTGKVRMVGPVLDDQSRNGLVYVDLPEAGRAGLRPGMFAHGEFQLGAQPALTVPQTALSLREGFSYVFSVHDESGGQARVRQVKVQPGRRAGDRIEILSGLAPADRVVASGVSFLADGDIVKVVP
ncbi:efflux RND transporter periplasmic adaptor subunit [Methylotetracoccus oryzae]|uniref:efflux RND transporter periplasmic adaptor subunit n=1 Tax=Methylotetracoccus oryzae TaxID=1919059 RepID=UPI00111A66A4|nr:efflux RND transporter periplasmic adaptor subunit [Methylotetracoccus oryzae]